MKRGFDRIRKEMMELGWLEGVCCRWAVLRLLAARLPFHIALLFHQSSGSLDLAVLEGSFQDIVPELTGQLGSVKFELRPEINWLVEIPKDRDPGASWGGNCLANCSQGKKDKKS